MWAGWFYHLWMALLTMFRVRRDKSDTRKATIPSLALVRVEYPRNMWRKRRSKGNNIINIATIPGVKEAFTLEHIVFHCKSSKCIASVIQDGNRRAV